ncbi:MAG: hypothetical protein AAF411_04100 [Myxococcota bacterium]
MDEVTVDYVMDRAYFLEKRREWTKHISQEARVDRWLHPLVFGGLVFLFFAERLFGLSRAVVLCLVGGLAATFLLDITTTWVRRKSWLKIMMKAKGGKRVRFAFRPRPVDSLRPELEAGVATLIETPKGYFLPLDLPEEHRSGQPEGLGVSSSKASIYIPRRAVKPQSAQDSLAKLLRTHGLAPFGDSPATEAR